MLAHFASRSSSGYFLIEILSAILSSVLVSSWSAQYSSASQVDKSLMRRSSASFNEPPNSLSYNLSSTEIFIKSSFQLYFEFFKLTNQSYLGRG
jgi:hypothetical protein